MTEKAVSSNASTAQGEARDLLLRLYREIGISAVAAALEVISGRSHMVSEPAATTIVASDERHLAA